MRRPAQFGLAIGLFLLCSPSITGCGSRIGPAPSDPNLGFAGVWQGQYRITDCTGDRHCSEFIGDLRTFVLRLMQSGQSLTGVLVLRQQLTDNAYYHGDLTINVAGSVASDGSLTLTGSKPSATPFDKSGDVDVQRMVVKPSASSGLSGTLGYSSRYTPVQNP